MTSPETAEIESKDISIHTLRVEGDKSMTDNEIKEGISIHTLRVEGDGIM